MVSSSDSILPRTANASTPKSQRITTTAPRPVREPLKHSRLSIKRPALHRAPTTQTTYVDLLMRLDEIPRWHNMLAAFSTWILLAGYLVFPATFTSLQTDAEEAVGDAAGQDVVTVTLASAVKNIGLLWLAGVCCVLGAAGVLYLWVKWWWHYIWLLNRVFLPAATSSLAGLISTLVNIYSAQNGHLSITAKVTVGVTASCSAIFSFLFVVHQLWFLRRVKKAHQKVLKRDEQREREEMERGADEQAEKNPLEKLMHRAQEPAAMPGGVV